MNNKNNFIFLKIYYCRRIKRYEQANQKCMIVKYENDTRYDDDDNENTIYTHDKYN